MGCPRFSVVIPVFNRADVIRRALDSVLAQDFEDLEVIVVDDGSTDDTLERLREVDDPRVRTVAQEREGAAAARNHGAVLAKGEFLTFLDSDDEVVPHWLSVFYALIREKNADFVSCGYRAIGAGESPQDGRIVGPKAYEELFGRKALVVTGGTYVVRRSLFDRAGGFSVTQRAGQHTELALRLLPVVAESGCHTAATAEPLLVRHVGRSDHIRGDDRAVFEGGKRLLDVHGEHYARHPERLATQASSTGVRAVRIGEIGEARRYLWLAVRARPSSLKGWGRLAAVLVPPVARRVWSPKRSAG